MAKPVNQHVAAICREFPDAGNRTLAKALFDKHPLEFVTLEKARNAVRQYRGNFGTAARKIAEKRGTARPGRKPGEMPALPVAIEENWTPYEIDAGRVLVVSDLHIRFHANIAIEAALKFGDTFKPDAVFVNGDLFDFYQLSRFDKNPTVSKLSAELEAGRQFWNHVRARFPKAKFYFKLGNHDERWDKYLWESAPLLVDIPGMSEGWYGPAGIVANKVNIIRDRRPVMLGHLPVFHGHELGQGNNSPVNPARGAFLRTKHTVMVSHSHQTSGHADPDLWHNETFVWSIGCLCQKRPYWRPINNWNWGFAAVTVHKDGEFDVQNLRINNAGKVRAS